MPEATAVQERPTPRRLLLFPWARPAANAAVAPQHTAPRRLRADRIAAWAVSGGGMAIIASILGIFAFIIAEVAPLLGDAEVVPAREITIDGAAMQALVGDEHRTHIVGLGVDGFARAVRITDGTTVSRRSILPPSAPSAEQPGLTHIATPAGNRLLSAATTDGRIALVAVDWNVAFEGDTRVVKPVIGDPLVMQIDDARRPIQAFAARSTDDGTTAIFAQLDDGSIAGMWRDVSTNAFTGETSDTIRRSSSARAC